MTKKLVLSMVLILACFFLVPGAAWLNQHISGGYGVKLNQPSLDFDWQDVAGQWHRFSDWQQGPSYVFLGFLNCSQICPVRLGQMFRFEQHLSKEWRGEALPVRFLFITVDPQNDSPALRNKIIDSQSSAFYSAQLPQQQLRQLQQRLVEQVSTQQGTIKHAGNLYLFSADARLQRVYGQWQLSLEQMQNDLNLLL